MQIECSWNVKRDGAMFRGFIDCKRSDGEKAEFRSIPYETYKEAKDWAKNAASCFRAK